MMCLLQWSSASEKPTHLHFSLLRGCLNYLFRLFVHAVLPISSSGFAVVRENVRFPDGAANSRLASNSVRPACIDFRADGLRQNAGGVSRIARCVVPARRGT